MQISLLLLLSFLALCLAKNHGLDSSTCSSVLCTTFQNELGSTMQIADVSNGFFAGTYQTAVGKAKGKYRLVGSYSGETLPATIGWTITWSNSNTPTNSPITTTSWTGVITLGSAQNCKSTNTCDADTLYLITQWHLSTPTTPQNYWQSTLSGMDLFSNSTSY